MLSNLLDNAVKYSRDQVRVRPRGRRPGRRRRAGARDRSGRRHSPIAAEAHLPPIPQVPVAGIQGEGHGPRSLHRAVHRARARRPRVRHQRRRGPRVHVHDRTPATGASLMARILVVEDEPHLAMGLRFNLEADGHDVSVAADGETALARLADAPGSFDAVVLDVMLPGKNGFEVARALRERGDYVPILMLTARARPEDVLQGFDAGVDDYLPKPFELPILLARVRSLLRRNAWARTTPPPDRAPEIYRFGGNSFDPSTLELRVGTHAVPPDGDGGGPAAVPAAQRRQGRVAQGHPRGRVGPARRHRHARHRQLHRPPATVPQRRPFGPPPRDHRPGRGISLHRRPSRSGPDRGTRRAVLIALAGATPLTPIVCLPVTFVARGREARPVG